jgi:hypothetical protein
MTKKSNNNRASTASRQNPCPLCGKEDWCYLIHNLQGEIEKILCDLTRPGSEPDDWEHIGRARDNRPIFTKKGIRRVRLRRNKAFPELIQLAPSPKSNIPAWQDVNIPIEQLSKGHTVRLKPENPEAGKLFEVKNIKSGKRQGKNCLLAHLVVKGGNSPTLEIEEYQIQSIVSSDPSTGAKEQFIEYYYSGTLKVVRTQWTDRREAYPGKKNKKVRPMHKVGDSWVEGKGGQQFPLYRLGDVASSIRCGEIVFAVAGELAADTLAALGLVGTTNQGGEPSCSQIAFDLAPIFSEVALGAVNVESEVESSSDASPEPKAESGNNAPSLKPLLVIWGDNDPKGAEFASELHKLCLTHRIPHVVLDPLLLWSGMPTKGDVKDWVDWCHKSGIPVEEMLYRLELAIEQAIDFDETDAEYRWQRSNWKAPVSWKGEIGKWIHKKDSPPAWQPLCNFDFQIECELSDSNGGALVLQVKRHFAPTLGQQRVILNSMDYTSTDKFVQAMKKALGTGISCSLTNKELNDLIAVRLHEYHTTRRGKVLKRIECYGQQEDGTWVFRDRQFTKEGQLTNEHESGWVFADVSSEGDEIPCPSLAPPNPSALKNLVDAARRFFGSGNIHQFLLTVGWVVAGLNSQEIFWDKKWFPLLNAHGEPGSCKTLAGEAALSLVGTNWAVKGMVSRASVSAIYEHGSKTGSLPFIWDDPPRCPETEEIFKTWANRKARQVRGNRQEPKSPLGGITNHVVGGDSSATYTRMARFPYERAASGDNAAFTQLQEAEKYASGAFQMLISIGYPQDQIAAIEKKLLLHLPQAHARIAQALAIIVCYAQHIVQLTGGSEDVLQWVIDHLCPAEDDADSAGNSLLDFISKLQALEAIDEVGDWNKKIVTDKNTGQQFVAVYAVNAWKMVDGRFKPATYNAHSLKVLVEKAGGKTGVTLKFAADKAQVLTYYNALINPRSDAEGNPNEPNKPRTTNRKAWLIPIELWGKEESDDCYGDDTPGTGNASCYEYLDDSSEVVATAATNRYTESVAAEIPVVTSISSTEDPNATTATSFEEENKIEINNREPCDRKTELNTPPTSNNELVAASKPDITSSLAATNNSVAASQTANVQQDAHQILLCSTWVEVARAIVSDAGKLMQAARVMTKTQHRQIGNLLASHVCDDPNNLKGLAWVPGVLLNSVLKRLSFTIRRIGGDTIEDAYLELIANCKFVNVNHLGQRYEQWLFQTPDGTHIPVFGAGDIEAIAP